jgi:nucleotide-binding universal stress UspA family protein
MFKHLLVPIDLSDRNTRLLGIAVSLARASRARVTLFHVVQRIANTSPREFASFYRKLEDKSYRTLATVAGQLSAAGVRVRTAVVIGDPAREIVRAALARKADLVVMGSHKVLPESRG